MEIRERRLKNLNQIVSIKQWMRFEIAKKIEQAVGCGSATAPLFGIQRKRTDSTCVHPATDFPFDQGVNQEGQDLDRQEGLDPDNALQQDRHDLADRLELLMSLFHLGLVLVFLKKVSGRKVHIIGYQGKPPVSSGLRVDGLRAGWPLKRKPALLATPIPWGRSGPPLCLLTKMIFCFFFNRDAQPAVGPCGGQRRFNRLGHSRPIPQAAPFPSQPSLQHLQGQPTLLYFPLA